MKVAIGFKLRGEPWGGGNQFAEALHGRLEERGIEVHRDLGPPDLDFILLCKHTRKRSLTPFTDADVREYLRKARRQPIVLQRVNDCDERKGTKDVNPRILHANLCADHAVFVSSWLRDLFLAQGLDCPANSVILNGSDRKIFNPTGHRPWDRSGPLRVVTHHWSANPMKGFDIYSMLDRMLGTAKYRGRVEFSYIGNIRESFRFENAVHVPPARGSELADLLRSHHVYLTGSMFEPGSNHQNEGANCGLPLLYRKHASLPEYCQGFGIEYGEADFEARLDEMIVRYDEFQPKMKDYPHTSERMAEDYCRLFAEMEQRREQILAGRSLRRRLKWWWREHVAKQPVPADAA